MSFTTRPFQGRDRRLLLLEGILLSNAGLVYGLAAGRLFSLAWVAIGLGLSSLLRRPLPRTSRSWVYSVVLVLVAAAVESQLFPSRDSRFFLPQATLYGPALLYGGVVLTFFAQPPVVVAAVAGCGLLVLMLAGSVLGPPSPAGAVAGFSALSRHFELFYRFGTVVQVVVMAALFQRAGVAAPTPGGGRRRVLRLAIVALALAITFAAARQMEKMAERLEPQLTRWYTRLVETYLRGRIRRIVFDSQVDLWRTVPARVAGDRTVVLRAIAERPPGYLRGRVYDRYRHGQWSSELEFRPLPSWPGDGLLAYTVFQRPLLAGDGQESSVMLLPEVVIDADVLFVPGRAFRFEVVADTLSINLAGVLRQSQWDQRAGYLVRQVAVEEAAYPLPTGELESQAWLEVPGRLQPSLAALAAVAFAGPAGGTSERVAEVVDFLGRRCVYQLEVHMQRSGRGEEPGLDPVLQFLDLNRRGHCELFATAAVLLLRSHGIPARYVTGLYCGEPAPGGGWVARLEHAHAWAEAYDPVAGRWLLVEATPPGGQPSVSSRLSTPGLWLEWLRMAWRTFLARLQRGEISEALARAGGWLWHGVVNVARDWWGWWVGGVGVGLLALWRFWRRRLAAQMGPELRRLRQIRRRFEAVARRHGLWRAEHETLAEFAERVAVADFAGAAELVVLLRAYQRLRFQPAARSMQAVAAFDLESRRQLGRWRGRKKEKVPARAFLEDEEEV